MRLANFCSRRLDLSLTRFGKTKRQLKDDEANYQIIAEGCSREGLPSYLLIRKKKKSVYVFKIAAFFFFFFF